MLAGVMTARVRIGLGMTVGDDPATVDPADRPVPGAPRVPAAPPDPAAPLDLAALPGRGEHRGPGAGTARRAGAARGMTARGTTGRSPHRRRAGAAHRAARTQSSRL